MSTPKIQRYDFGSLRDFRGPVVAPVERPVMEEAPPPPPPPSYTEVELAEARAAGRKQGYSEGFAAGRLEAHKEADARADAANRAIAGLAEAIAPLGPRYRELLKDESAALSKLVVAIARKVAAEALNERGVEVIAGIVSQALPILLSKPKLMIDLHPEMLEPGMALIEALLAAQGFEGELQFRSDAELELTDIRLDWVGGQMTRASDALWEEIDALMMRVPLEITLAETNRAEAVASG